VQVNVNVLLAAVSVGVPSEPAVAFGPDQPPLALHAVALVDVHVNVDVPALATLVGDAVSCTCGAGMVTLTVADALALPPAPLHVSV
jgi:hypothetical protein